MKRVQRILWLLIFGAITWPRLDGVDVQAWYDCYRWSKPIELFPLPVRRGPGPHIQLR